MEIIWEYYVNNSFFTMSLYRKGDQSSVEGVIKYEY